MVSSPVESESKSLSKKQDQYQNTREFNVTDCYPCKVQAAEVSSGHYRINFLNYLFFLSMHYTVAKTNKNTLYLWGRANQLRINKWCNISRGKKSKQIKPALSPCDLICWTSENISTQKFATAIWILFIFQRAAVQGFVLCEISIKIRNELPTYK